MYEQHVKQNVHVLCLLRKLLQDLQDCMMMSHNSMSRQSKAEWPDVVTQSDPSQSPACSRVLSCTFPREAAVAPELWEDERQLCCWHGKLSERLCCQVPAMERNAVLGNDSAGRGVWAGGEGRSGGLELSIDMMGNMYPRRLLWSHLQSAPSGSITCLVLVNLLLLFMGMLVDWYCGKLGCHILFSLNLLTITVSFNTCTSKPSSVQRGALQFGSSAMSCWHNVQKWLCDTMTYHPLRHGLWPLCQRKLLTPGCQLPFFPYLLQILQAPQQRKLPLYSLNEDQLALTYSMYCSERAGALLSGTHSGSGGEKRTRGLLVRQSGCLYGSADKLRKSSQFWSKNGFWKLLSLP